MDDLTDEKILRRSFNLAKLAKNRGNGAYGAVLAEGKIVLFEAESTVTEDRCDPTCHAEMNVLREACKLYSKDEFSRFTLYCSCEPCAMCLGALYSCGVGRVVFGCSSVDLKDRVGLAVSCRDVLADNRSAQIEIVGPLLESDALALHSPLVS